MELQMRGSHCPMPSPEQATRVKQSNSTEKMVYTA